MVKLTLLLSTLLLANNVYSNETNKSCEAQLNLQFTYSWPLEDGCENKPRGGTSQGTEVEFATEPRPEWLALQDSDLSKFEKDRRAILAMQGGYKINFDFLETVGFSNDFERDRPYQSWGTEYIYVVEDQPEHISLQHLMVMVFIQEDGSISEPMVMKHWRQDWTYEDTSLLEYQRDNTWRKRALPASEVTGTWSQAVFQVDDSPRYESYGRWEHNASFSSWISEKTHRPLPRREYSVRNDYNLLEGFNRHTVTRTGWVQEEENWKLSLNDQGLPDSTLPYLSKEEGLARYQEIKNFDFSAGDEYMERTELVWETVRQEWKNIIINNQSIHLEKSVDGEPMFMPLFNLASNYSPGSQSDSEIESQVKLIINKYLTAEGN